MKYFHTLALLLICTISHAQLSQIKRIEIPFKEDGVRVYSHDVYTSKKYGLIHQYKQKKSKSPDITLTYDFYDNNLTLVGSETYELEDREVLTGETYQTNRYLYDLTTKGHNKDRSFRILRCSFKDHTVERKSGKLPPKSSIEDIFVLSNTVFIMIRTKGERMFITFDWETGKQTIEPIEIPNVKSRKISITTHQVNHSTGQVILNLKTKIKKERTNYLSFFDKNGKHSRLDKIPSIDDTYMIMLNLSEVKGNTYLCTGTYTELAGSTLATGFYFGSFNGTSFDYLNRFKFNEFENFFEYLSASGQERVEKKKKRKESKGKELKVSCRIAFHDVMEREDGYLLLGEAYRPTYRTETRTVTSTGANGVVTTTTQSYQVFDGYQYTHAILCLLDLNGNLIWDQVFKLEPSYKPMYVKRFVNLPHTTSGDIKLSYASSGSINTKIISAKGEIVQEATSEDVESLYTGDKLKRSMYYLDHWYKDRYIIHGTERIVNKENDKVKKKRRSIYSFSLIEFK